MRTRAVAAVCAAAFSAIGNSRPLSSVIRAPAATARWISAVGKQARAETEVLINHPLASRLRHDPRAAAHRIPACLAGDGFSHRPSSRPCLRTRKPVAGPRAAIAGRNVHALLPAASQQCLGLLMARFTAAPISPLQSGRTPMSGRSTRVKVVLGSAGLVIATVTAATAAPASATAQGADSTYIVLYRDGASSAGAAATVSGAGGTLVANYPQIGVVIARSSNPNFAATVQQNGKVGGAARTDGFATKVSDVMASSGPVNAPVPAPGSDNLSGLQWDMNQINAPQAHATNGGSPGVVVGDIDTGLDFTHPDLAPNVDFADSASCIGGVADTSPAAWMDDNGHGTHTAGTLAAAKNGIGIVGVAAEGNQADDLSHPTVDATSPDNTTPVTRDITNACAVVPVEVPGVVGVTATGNLREKSFYSSYGVSTTDVAAPGGDSILQQTAAAPNGRVLSTYPASLINTCLRKVFDGTATYCYLQGTSMASPHAAGVAALLESATGKTAGALAAYAFYPDVDGGAPKACQGGAGHNRWYGPGEVDALKAVG